MARVPLARRNLLAEPRRLAAGVAGIGLALMLILLLGGLWAGIQAQSVRYVDGTGATLWVLPADTRTLFSEGTQLPTSTLEVVRATPGVAWAAPALGQYAILDLHDTKAATVLIGSEPGQPGGAWALARGRAPTADDEVAIDRVLADRHALTVGDRLTVADRSYRVVGITRHAGFMTGYVFATHRAVQTLLHAPGKTNAVLVGTEAPTLVRARLAARGLAVLDTPELRRSVLEANTRVFGSPLRLMVAIAFLAGVLIVAMTRLRPGGRAPPRVRDHQGAGRQSPPPGRARVRPDAGLGCARPGRRWAAAGRGAGAAELGPATVRGRHHRWTGRASGGDGAGDGAAGRDPSLPPAGPAGSGDRLPRSLTVTTPAVSAPLRTRPRRRASLRRPVGGGVPLARRNLFENRRRVLLSTGGVAVALLLVLVLGGILAGAMRQLTGYIDRSGADLIVSQLGVRTMHMSASVLRDPTSPTAPVRCPGSPGRCPSATPPGSPAQQPAAWLPT
jgi:hypothetical protein